MTSQQYTYIWEYEVYPHADAEFRRHYGSQGSWVELFRQAPGYVGTQLFRDRDRCYRYVTVDTWESEAAHADFRRRLATAFAELDRRCEQFTARETRIGHFAPIRDDEDAV